MAFTLMDSLKRVHPEARRCIWLLDHQAIEAPAGVEILDVRRSMTSAEFSALLLRYDILELATAVKPRCLEFHFSEGADRVFYFDPDIFVYQPLDAAMSLLSQGAGVLTPHVLAPLPRDGAAPSDLDILRSGLYNLGFIGLRAGPETSAFLIWWGDWLKTHCFRDPASGVFTDQKWIDFAPLF